MQMFYVDEFPVRIVAVKPQLLLKGPSRATNFEAS